MDVDVDEVVDTPQECTILVLEAKATGQKLRMDALISFQEACGVTTTRNTQMVVSNCPSSHMARYGRNLAAATDKLCDQDRPCHMDVRADGTFAGLGDDEEDAIGNPCAIAPCDVRPDSVVSQHAVIPYASCTIVPHQTGDNVDNVRRRNEPVAMDTIHVDRPQGSTTNVVV